MYVWWKEEYFYIRKIKFVYVMIIDFLILIYYKLYFGNIEFFVFNFLILIIWFKL